MVTQTYICELILEDYMTMETATANIAVLDASVRTLIESHNRLHGALEDLMAMMATSFTRPPPRNVLTTKICRVDSTV